MGTVCARSGIWKIMQRERFRGERLCRARERCGAFWANFSIVHQWIPREWRARSMAYSHSLYGWMRAPVDDKLTEVGGSGYNQQQTATTTSSSSRRFQWELSPHMRIGLLDRYRLRSDKTVRILFAWICSCNQWDIPSYVYFIIVLCILFIPFSFDACLVL